MADRHIYCVHDKLYNLAKFVDKHPGGANVFSNLKSHTDITPLIYTYHKDVSLIRDILLKYDISANANHLSQVAYRKDYNYDKYVELKTLVYKEISIKELPLYWSFAETLYNLGGFVLYVGIWAHCNRLVINSRTVSAWWFVLLAAINIGHCALFFHETSHYCGFKNQYLNTLVSHIAVAPVLTTEEWKWDHNYLHHGFTNTGFDVDFNGHQLTLRHSANHPHRFQHRFQHIYAWVLMCLGGLSGQIDSIKHDRWNIFLFFYIVYWFGIKNSAIFYFLTGFLFLVTAQLSHIQPECVRGEYTDFLENQVMSTMNYKTDNIVCRLMCFGLDIQIEHHLFPNIPHSTLRQIQHIVRDYCRRNGIPYREKANVFEMLKSYWWHLYEMGIVKNDSHFVKN